MIREFKNWRACYWGDAIGKDNVGVAAHSTARSGRDHSSLISHTAMRLLIALLFVFAVVPPVNAIDRVEVAVNGQDENEKLDAYRVAMRWLLQQHDSSGNVANSELVRAAIRDAGDFVDEFEFRSASDGDVSLERLPITAKVRETGKATHVLAVTLSSDALAALVAKESQLAESESADGDVPDKPAAAVARDPRRALLWLLVVDEQREIMVAEPNAEPVVSRLRELAGGFGWNLYFPRLDTLDLSLLGPDDLAEPRLGRIAEASTRYQQSQVLVGTMTRRVTGQWQANWTRLTLASVESLENSFANSENSDELGVVAIGEAATTRSFSETGDTLDDALQRGVAWLVGEIDDAGETITEDVSAGTQFGSGFGTGVGSGLGDQGALLWLGNINSVSAYAKSVKFLARIEQIESAQPLSTGESGMLFSISPRTAITAISAAASEQSWLQLSAKQSGTNESAAQADLYLNIIP